VVIRRPAVEDDLRRAVAGFEFATRVRVAEAAR